MAKSANKAALLIAFVLLALAGNVNACMTIPPRKIPDRQDLVRTSEIVAVIHVDRIDPLTPEEEATLLRGPPRGVSYSFPGQSVHFSVRRILKGSIPDGALIRNGATSCEVVLSANEVYVLFANQPASSGDRILPLDGTFRFRSTPEDAAIIADLESLLSPAN